MHEHFYVYIITNKYNQVLYTRFTNDLTRRVWEHKEKAADGFTKRYNANKLVYYEGSDSLDGARNRDAQIKAGSRRKKIMLIESMNKEWKDLFDEL